MDNFRKLNQYIALFCLLFTGVIFSLTVAPTVSYWDCGEYIASAFLLGIQHPPGNPTFMLVGRVASMLATSVDKVAFIVNYLSVIAASFSVFFLYLNTMRLYTEWKGKVETLNGFIKRASSALIGSLTLAFSHTYWFNAVETEMYIYHIFFISIIIWLALVWSEKHNEEGSDRYLYLIAYLIGLSIGYHLLTVLIIPFVVIVYYNKKVKVKSTSKLISYSAGGIVLTGIVFPGVVKYLPAAAKFFGSFYVSAIIILLFGFYAYYLIKNNKSRHIQYLVGSLFLIMLGYSTYGTIIIRSSLDPKLDMNNPETVNSFYSYVNREQYGELTMFPRRWKVKSNYGKTWIGDGSGVLHRFPDGSVKKIQSVEELGPKPKAFEHFWEQVQYTIKYQLNHMFFRYIGWNFVGLPDFEKQHADSDPSKLWGLPLLLCIIGAVFMYYRDPDNFWAMFSIWFMFGLAVLVYLNQNDPQPRERDYSLIAVFYIMGLWISYSVYFILDELGKKLNNKAINYAVIAILFALVPARMLAVNYESHDRSDNLVAWEYSKNILESSDENAILFNNGDNDTYPIWYLQMVEGIRPDVTAINLSLFNTPWYIKQHKNGQIGQAAPINMSEQAINEIQIRPWKEQTIKIPLKRSVKTKDFSDFSNNSLRRLNVDTTKDYIEFKLGPQYHVPTPQGPVGVLRVQDLMSMHIILANNWERPINWALTVGSGNTLGGLKEYLRLDGLVYKLTSIKGWNIDPKRMEELLFDKYLFTNLSNEDVYYDDQVQGLLSNYYSLFLQLAGAYGEAREYEKQASVFKRMAEIISSKNVPYPNRAIELSVEAVTKFNDASDITADALSTYSNQDLDMLFQIYHASIKNLKFRDKILELYIERLDQSDTKRIQLLGFFLKNMQDKEKKDSLKTKYLEEYKDNERFKKVIEQM